MILFLKRKSAKSNMYTIKQLCEYTRGKIINGDANKIVTQYSVNHKFNIKNGLYIPIEFHGESREKYIIDAVKLGSIGFMINKDSENKKTIIKEAKILNANICILEVSNVNDAIYNLAKINREKYIDKPIIGITGSVGKTSMSRILSNILKKEYKVLHDFDNRNMNTKVLIANDLMHLENYDMAVIEMATSQPGRIQILSELVKPSIAVITSIGTSHIKNFHSRENILKEKLHIVDYLKDEKLFFINNDNDLLNCTNESNAYKLIKCSKNDAKDISENENGLSFEVQIYNKPTKLKLNIYGLHYITSIIIAIRIAEHYKIKYENIIAGINEFKPIAGRGEVIKNREQDITLFNDCYNASIDSMKSSLAVLKSQKAKRKIAVLGDMLELGKLSKELHEEVGVNVVKNNVDILIAVGKEINYTVNKAIEEGMNKENIKYFYTNQEAIDYLKKEIKNGDAILIKASNGMSFKEIVEALKTII